MWASKVASTLSKLINPVSWWCVVIGAVAVFVMMAVVVIDVVLRAGFSMGVLGNIEIIATMLIIAFFAGYAYAETKGQHIQVDVLVQRLPATAGKIIITSGYLLTIGITIIISWRYMVQGMAYKAGSVVTGLLGIPEWPFLMLAAFFMALFALALVVSFLNHLAELLTIGKIKGYLWLLPGIIVALGFFVFSMWPDLLPFEITLGLWGGIISLLLFILIFLKVHIGAAMALVTLLGMSYISGAEAGLYNLSLSAVHIASTYTWCVVPLFMWMGLLAYYGGFAKELYYTAYTWIGNIPGGLASATTAACAGLAAITGSSMTGVITMGAISLPQMRAYKYDMKLATGAICTASTIGALIPPSLIFIVYGMMTETSISKLFIAGVLPGILFTGILIIMITMMCRINPRLGPAGPRTSWKLKIGSLKDVWAVGLLVIVCIGGLYMGVFTPTEAGAIGAGGALVISLARRRLTFKSFTESIAEAVRMTGIIFFIFVFAIAFSHFLALTKLTYELANWIIGLGLSPYVIISLILFIYMILGCVMNSLPAVILTLPIFFPMAMAAGFDPVWFGVLITVMVDLGQITPPIGMNVFAMSAIATDIPMYSIFRGVLPFWVAFIVLVIILVIFPQISLFLPSFM